MTPGWSVVWEHAGLLAQGVVVTVELTVLTMALAVPCGLALALGRTSGIPIARAPCAAFIEFFRATPLVLQIYWAFYVLPYLTGFALSAFLTAVIGLTANVSAYNAETFRGGLMSIRRGQRDAGMALGMTSRQNFRIVVLPQALRRVLPALATTWVSLFKDTSLVAVIAVHDLSYVSIQLRSQSFRVVEVLTAMAGIYWLLGYPQAKIADAIYNRFSPVE